MAHAPAKRSFAGIANITCGSSRGKDNFFLLNKCVVQVKNHLRSCSLSRTKVTEYDLILARAGKFNRSHEEVEKMVVCLAHRHSLGIYWRPRKTVVILAMKENRLPFTVKNQLTRKWRIQEICEIFVTLVHLMSRRYFQSQFCFNFCPFLLKKWLGINKWGKRIN